MAEPARKRQQRRGDKTKRRLIEVTKQLFSEFDYHSITLDQISAAGGVAKSSILWHFGSKEALLTEAVFEIFEEVDQRITLEKSNLETLEQRIDYLLAAVGEYFMANPEAKGVAITLIFNSQVSSEIHDRILEQWEQHIDEVRDFLSLDDVQVSRSCANTILALMQGCYVHWYLRGRKEDISETLPEAFKGLYGEINRLIGMESR